jgi:hypothetical protein
MYLKSNHERPKSRLAVLIVAVENNVNRDKISIMKDPKDENTKTHLQSIARMVDNELPDGWGFILMTFPFNNPDGRLNYVAKCSREDGVKIVRKWLDTQTPENFGKDV